MHADILRTQCSVASSQDAMAVARRTLEAGLSVLRGRASRETRPKTAAMPSTKAYQLPPHYSSLIPQYPMQTYVRGARQRNLLSTLRHADPGRTDTHREGEVKADKARPSRGGELSIIASQSHDRNKPPQTPHCCCNGPSVQTRRPTHWHLHLHLRLLLRPCCCQAHRADEERNRGGGKTRKTKSSPA